jgi:hypothetical protein
VAGEVAGDVTGAGTFLTDGVFLYRVVRSAPGGVGELVELEDCFTLDVVHARVADLCVRRLRVVTPAPVERREEPKSG